MKDANERLELLKWVSTNLPKVESLTKKLEGLQAVVGSYAPLQDVPVVNALAAIENLQERMIYLDKQIDSQLFVNEGILRDKK
jgi:hypothetical protein